MRTGGPRAPAPAVAALAVVATLAAPGASAPPQEPQAPPPAGQEAEALVRYREAAAGSDDPVDHYNYGTALLDGGRALEAREPLRQAMDSEIETVERFGRYNYGLSHARAGDPDAEPDPGTGGGAAPGGDPEEDRRELLLRAREAFREVLRRDPADDDARWNLELVDRWLEEERQGQGSGSGEGSSGPAGGGAGAGSSGSGAASGSPRELGREEAEALLEQAGRAEAEIRDRLLGRGRFRDPVVEKNW